MTDDDRTRELDISSWLPAQRAAAEARLATTDAIAADPESAVSLPAVDDHTGFEAEGDGVPTRHVVPDGYRRLDVQTSAADPVAGIPPQATQSERSNRAAELARKFAARQQGAGPDVQSVGPRPDAERTAHGPDADLPAVRPEATFGGPERTAFRRDEPAQ
ncbi:MAG TPA: hypothetical protein VGJ28_13730, partial [Micromonosporaceae bacterium]